MFYIELSYREYNNNNNNNIRNELILMKPRMTTTTRLRKTGKARETIFFTEKILYMYMLLPFLSISLKHTHTHTRVLTHKRIPIEREAKELVI